MLGGGYVPRISFQLNKMDLGAVSEKGDLALGNAMEEDLLDGYLAPPGGESSQ